MKCFLTMRHHHSSLQDFREPPPARAHQARLHGMGLPSKRVCRSAVGVTHLVHHHCKCLVSQEELGSQEFNQQKLSAFLFVLNQSSFWIWDIKKWKEKHIWYTTTCLWHNLHNVSYYEVLHMYTCTRECMYLCMCCWFSRSRSAPGLWSQLLAVPFYQPALSQHTIPNPH